MPTSKHNGINLNSIFIRLIPNPQYLQIAASDYDSINDYGIIELYPHQIQSLEIKKSFDLHRTIIHVSLMNITGDIKSGIYEGKYLLLIKITANSDKHETFSFANYFIFDKILTKNGLDDLAGNIPIISSKFSVKSILSTRLDIENHLSFELGGKGGTALVGSGKKPLDFLSDEFSEYFGNAYSPDTRNQSFENHFDLSMTASGDQQVTVNTGPSNGYKFESDTNFHTIEYFFEHYPLFKTPYNWIIDDFNTNLKASTQYQGSLIKVLDLVRYDYWSAGFDSGLSETLNRKFGTSSGTNNSSASSQMKIFALVSFRIKERKSFINVSKYLFRDNLPLIYAQRVEDGEPISMDWNNFAGTSYVLTSSPSQLHVKEMQNPRYQHFLTFMSEQEIADTQKYKNVFMNLNPELVTYVMDNIYFGNVDLHTCIYLEKEIVGEGDSYNKSKMGVGYDVYHKFVNVNPTPADMEQISNTDKMKSLMFTPSFKLTTEITFLQVNMGQKTLEEYSTIQRQYSNIDQSFSTTDLTLFDTINSCGKYNDVELGGLPIAEPGTPGNTSIESAGHSLINNGFRYLWGGMRAKAMDCSGFTMWAVRNGGGDSGRRTRYPKGTTAQINWLTDQNNGAIRVKSVDEIQPGDIVFFKTKRCGHCHTGIAKDKNSYWHSNSVNKKGADMGSFSRRRPSYIFRLLPMNKTEDK